MFIGVVLAGFVLLNAVPAHAQELFGESEMFSLKTDIAHALVLFPDTEERSAHHLFGIERMTQEEKDELVYEKRLVYWKEKQQAYWESLPKGTFTINASAYTAAADECGKSDGITASGLKVMANRTLACPPQYPFGARIYIESMGEYRCEDRGGAIKGNKFDIYMETKSEAFAFGRRNLTAYVVE